MYPGFPQPGPARALPRVKVRPSKGWFAIPFLIVVGGGAFAAKTYVQGLSEQEDDVNALTRSALPAALAVELTPGEHAIYHEFDGAATDEIRQRPDPVVTVTGPAGPLTLDEFGGLETYAAGAHEGEGAYTFTVDTAGAYQVAAQVAPGGDTTAGIAVGPSVADPEQQALITAAVGAAVALLLTVILATARAISGRRARNRVGAVDAYPDGQDAGLPPGTRVVAQSGAGWGAPGTTGNWSQTGGHAQPAAAPGASWGPGAAPPTGSGGGWSSGASPSAGPGGGWSPGGAPPPTGPGGSWSPGGAPPAGPGAGWGPGTPQPAGPGGRAGQSGEWEGRHRGDDPPPPTR
jgi:hypothetical protein